MRVVLIVVFTLALAGCGKQPQPPAPFVAKIGETTIAPEEFKRELLKRSHGTIPQKEAVLQELIRTETLLLRAREAGFDKDPEIAARVRRLIATAYEEKLRGPERRAAHADAELEEYYAQNRADFIAPGKVRVAQILIRVPRKATEEKRIEYQAKAGMILEKAKLLPAAVTNFGDLAREFSEDQASRYQGGDAGWLTQPEAEGRFGSEIADALFKLESPGALSGPLPVLDGIALFKLIGREGSKPKPLADVRELVAYRLTRQKEAAEQKQFEQNLRAGLKIEIDRPLADSIIAAVTNAPAIPPSTPVN